MEITKKDTCILFNFNDLADWNTFHEANGANEFSTQYHQNTIFSFPENVSFDELLLENLGKFSLALSELNKSFVVVTDFAKEDIDHELNLVPTENEAIEFIFMEEIERSL